MEKKVERQESADKMALLLKDLHPIKYVGLGKQIATDNNTRIIIVTLQLHHVKDS